ncbi:ankyrin repeat domain-containing protein 50-like [Haliotis asinina]|uniref:ankyrin repeat domain-containing protein 50-like n=1 Tax=Haliotis asinina TaxID=109174 RepID=UPI0035319AC6
MLEIVLAFLLLFGDVRGQECPVGMYGDNCKLNCSRYCAPYDEQKVYCDKQSGKCSEGCIPGRYGDRCHLTCSRNCRNDVCSVQTGHCAQGCTGNNTGHFCEISREPASKQSQRASQDTASLPLSQDAASTALVPILVPVMVIPIVIITAVTVFCMLRRKCHRERPYDVEDQEVLNPEDTDLIVACKQGNLRRVKDILEQNMDDINKKGKEGLTPVMWAARRGYKELVDFLVKKGADVKLVDGIGNNILHWACFGGHVPMVKHVVSKNIGDINCRGRDERTPLMCVARQGNKEMFHLLVSKGGLTSQVDADGNNILHLACWGGNIEIVEYILSHDDVDINGRGQFGRTPLMAAAYKGHGKIFDLLVTKGADHTAVDDAGGNVLHVACLGGHMDIVSCVLELDMLDINSNGQCGRTPLMMAASNGDRDIFDLLVNKGADATLLDEDNNTILHLAAKGGHVEIVKYALAVKSVDINARNKHHETATMLATDGSEVCNLLVSHRDVLDTDLHVACMDGKLKSVRDILDHSLEDIDKPGKGGMTPVMWAARRGHREMVDLLVKKGADAKRVDDVGNNILHWACYGGHVAMVKHVVSKNMVNTNIKGRDDRTPLMCAARQGIKDMFQLLVSKGGLPSHVDRDGNNILLLACWGGNVKIVDYILSHDNVDINGKGQSGRTPLMGAAYKGHDKIFDLLVTKGADVNVVDDDGDNVLHSACLSGHVDIVSRILKLQKVDINRRGQCGRTPLMMAARMGDREIFDLLVKEGADATLVDGDSNTILHLASEGGNVNIVKYALEVKNMDINARNKRNETATMLAQKGSDVCNLLVQLHGLIQ